MAVILVVSVLLLFVLWIWYQNEVTLLQRLDLFPKARDASFNEKLKLYKKVSYKRHLLARVFLSDPFKLYDPILTTSKKEQQND